MNCESLPAFESSAWEQERSWFNHHRLKNQFENQLGAFVSMLAGNLGSEPVPWREFSRLSSEWGGIRSDLKALIGRFYIEGGPARFFRAPPLCLLPSEVRSWMEPLSRDMWWRRIGGGDLLCNVHVLLRACDAAFFDLSQLIGEYATSGDVYPSVPLADVGERFHKAVHDLSEGFTRLKQRSYVDS